MNDTDNTHNTNSECDNVLGDHFEAEKQSLRICSALMHGIFAGTCKNKALLLLCHARNIEGLCKIIKVCSHSSNNHATSRLSRLKQMNGRDLLALAKKNNNNNNKQSKDGLLGKHHKCYRPTATELQTAYNTYLSQLNCDIEGRRRRLPIMCSSEIMQCRRC